MIDDFLKEFLRLAGLGAIGGLARYLQLTYLETRIFNLGMLIANMVVGSVCGVALGWLIGSIQPSWSNVTAIVSGVVGLQLVYALTSLMVKITGKQFGVEAKDIEMPQHKTEVKRRVKKDE